MVILLRIYTVQGRYFFRGGRLRQKVCEALILYYRRPLRQPAADLNGLHCSVCTPSAPSRAHPLRNTAANLRMRTAARSSCGTSKPTFRPRSGFALRWLPAPTEVCGCFSWRDLSPPVNTRGVCKSARTPRPTFRPRRRPTGQRVVLGLYGVCNG